MRKIQLNIIALLLIMFLTIPFFYSYSDMYNVVLQTMQESDYTINFLNILSITVNESDIPELTVMVWMLLTVILFLMVHISFLIFRVIDKQMKKIGEYFEQNSTYSNREGDEVIIRKLGLKLFKFVLMLFPYAFFLFIVDSMLEFPFFVRLIYITYTITATISILFITIPKHFINVLNE